MLGSTMFRLQTPLKPKPPGAAASSSTFELGRQMVSDAHSAWRLPNAVLEEAHVQKMASALTGWYGGEAKYFGSLL